MKCLIFTLLILSAGFWFEPEIRAQSNTNVVVSFATTNATPLNLGFASCGDGTLTVGWGTAPGEFQVVQTVHTPRGARTMGIDPTTHTLYLPTAEFEPQSQGQSRPRPKPGSFMIVVVPPSGK